MARSPTDLIQQQNFDLLPPHLKVQFPGSTPATPYAVPPPIRPNDMVNSGTYIAPGGTAIIKPPELAPIPDLDRYAPSYTRAFRDILGQSGEAPLGQVREGTSALIGAFAEQFRKKTGKTPDASLTEQFIGEALTPHYAMQVLTGSSTGPLAQTAARNFLLANPDILPAQDAAIAEQERALRARSDALNKELEALRTRLKVAGTGRIRERFGEARDTLAESERALGRYRSPVASIPEAKLAAEEGKSITDFETGIDQTALEQQGDLLKFIETIMAGERRAGEQVSQFQQKLGLTREGMRADEVQNFVRNRLAKEIGEAQARAQREASEKSWVDYLDTGINAAKLGLSLYSGLPISAVPTPGVGGGDDSLSGFEWG